MPNSITAHYKAGNFVVSYDLDAGVHKLEVYDRIEIKEIATPFEGCENTEDFHIFSSVQVTSSTLHKDTIEMKPLAQLGLGEGKYYACFYSATEDQEIARSGIFTVDQEGDVSGAAIHEEKDVCSINVVKTSDGKKNCELELHWNFREEEEALLQDHLSNSDYLVVIASSDAHDIKNMYHSCAFVMASGKAEGNVKVRVAGYCVPGTEYQIIYFDTTLSLRRGASDPFHVDDKMLPELDMNDQDAVQNVKNDSSKFNYMSVMQYTMQDQMKNVKAGSNYNPLLTIVPKQGKWGKMIEDDRKRYEQMEEEANMELEKAKHAKNTGITSAEKTDEVISDVETEARIKAAIKDKPAFLYCGAGISISAPSCSPSWWTLMSNVLEETFNAVPEEHQGIAKKLRTSDNARSPEEVMETYYFVLQKKLFSLFELLNEGEPNANHRIIAKMVKQGKVRCILTTNFDEFIERALDDEGVQYTAICTSDEFKQFLDGGYKGFVILKIHGTVSRPDTIVAVANHYKGGKGFGGVKATVTQHFISSYPTIFFGYSGWDFVHANYQEFWDIVGKRGGEKVYFVKYKGSKGGPLISNLVGRHIGDRLIIGEAIMPDLACSVMESISKEDSREVMDFHNKIGPDVYTEIAQKQKDFVSKWVSNSISKPAILAILWNECSYLNESTELRNKKMKNLKGESDGATMDTAGVTAYMMLLATELGQGVITEKEYNQKLRRATMEITFSYVAMPKRQKDELIDIVIKESDTNSLLKGADGQDLLAMLPSYLHMAADGADVDTPSQAIFDSVMKYISDVLNPLYEKRGSDRKSAVLYNIYYSQSGFLRIRDAEDQKEATNLIEKYAQDAVEQEWSDEVVTDMNTKEITPMITRISYQQIDIKALIKSQVDYICDLSSSGKGTVDDILDGAFIIAISLERQAVYRTSDLYTNSSMMHIIQMLTINENKNIPEAMFESIEREMNKEVQPVLDIVQGLQEAGATGSSLSPKEVLSTFVLANVGAIKLCLKYIGNSAQTQRARESSGYYPTDPVPAAAATYLAARMEEAVKYIEDDRAEQPALAMLVALGEISGNITQMQRAVNTSLAITEGKVTEVTPVPIPEALAAAYQASGNLEKAMYYYKLALGGIRTFVIRQKTDAIVLNACLVMAQTDKKEALTIAFDYSPFFSDTQLNISVGPCRSLLVQQCEAWSKELGFASLSAAQEKLLKSDEDQKESFDNTFQRNPVVEEGHEEQLETAPLDNVTNKNLEDEDNTDALAIEEPMNQQALTMPEIEIPEIPLYDEQEAMTIPEFSLPAPVLNIPPSNRDVEEEPDKKQKTDPQAATVGKKSCGSCNVM